MSIKNAYTHFNRAGFLKVSLFIFLILFTFNTTVFSWYSPTKTEESYFIDKCSLYKKHFPASSYVIYNNDKSNINCNDLIPESKKNFIVADRINLDIPLNLLLMESSILLENYLNRLLYVNLRIQKLVSEYDVFRKTSQNVLKNLKNPLFDTNQKLVSGHDIFRKTSQDVLKKLKTPFFATSQKTGKNKKNDVGKYLKKIREYREQRDKLEIDLKNIMKDRIAEKFLSIGNHEGAYYIKYHSSEIDGIKIVSEKENFGEDFLIERREDVDKKFPWILKIFFQIIESVSENKLQWLFASAFILFIFILKQPKK
ncbi:MAG: hypothetical protein CSB21_01775 [Deltaproteobacteria bacterium]|nr:MAG: hypothetical protein CSB21_01775 [Deltaproteobacteria bacterium]